MRNMQCNEIKDLLDRFKTLSDNEKSAVRDHINSCADCFRLYKNELKLSNLLEVSSSDDESSLVSLEMMRNKVEQEEFEPRPLPKFVPYVSIVAALFLLMFIVSSFYTEEDVATIYDVTLENVDPQLVDESDEVCEMLFAAGIYDASVDLIGCSNTCNLMIMDLKTDEEVDRVVNLFNDINENEIIYQVTPIQTEPI